MRRNGVATGVLAEACAARGIDLLVVSTNEVFDGRRTDGRGYLPTTPPAPSNPYGASKLAGERAGDLESPFERRRPAAASLGDRSRRPGCSGRPATTSRRKILAAAERARGRRRAAAGRRRRVGHADLRGRPGRGHRRAPRRRRHRGHPPPRQRPVRVARRLGELRRRPGRHRRRDRAGPGVDLAARRRARRAGACSSRRRCRPASRCGSGPMRWPTTRRAPRVATRGADRRRR